MAYIYSTTTPYYFDYLASCRTRREIEEDPELCKYLEDPYLKDNMEMALRFKEAKRGGYQEKKDFVEYFLANGPELDTDTIVYYRDKCYQDPVYIQIAEIEFSDISIIDDARVNKYGKSNDLNDCFTKPCNYLGPMSSVVGIMGDSNNYKTFPNLFSTLLKGNKEDKENLKAAWGAVREHLTNKIMPDIRISMQMLYDSMYAHAQTFAEECKKAGITDSADIGDPYAIARAEDIASAVKINLYNQMGDCARIWEHMRRFNPYDLNQNKKQPIPESALKDNKSVNGAAIDRTSKPKVTTQVPPKKLKEMAAQGNKKAQWEIDLENINFGYTMSDIQYLNNPNLPIQEKLTFIRKRQEEVQANLSTKQKQQQDFATKYKDNIKALERLDLDEEEARDIKDEFYKIYNSLISKVNQKVEAEQIKEETGDNRALDNYYLENTGATMDNGFKVDEEVHEHLDEVAEDTIKELEEKNKQIEAEQNKSWTDKAGDALSEAGDKIKNWWNSL